MPISDRFGKRFYACVIGPEVSDEMALKFIGTCRSYEACIAAVVVNLCQIRLAAAYLEEAGIEVVGPIAYPLGNLPTELKRAQLRESLRDGAASVAAVMKLEALRAGDYLSARHDAQEITGAAARQSGSAALIGNSASLTDLQAVEAARIARDLGCAYVTNTGFGANSRPDHVRVIREALGQDLKIIAAGGCRTAEQAVAYLQAGADAIATSTPFQILEQLDKLAAGETRM